MNENNNSIPEAHSANDEYRMPPRYVSGTNSHIKLLPFMIIIYIIYGVYLSTVISSIDELVPFISGSAITDMAIMFLLIPICCALIYVLIRFFFNLNYYTMILAWF